jgi:hypothetical protein
MTLPAFLFGFLISTMLGAAFHLWKDGGVWRLLLFLILSGSGFWLGHALSLAVGWDFWKLGPLRIGFAIIGSVVFLGVGYWLSLINPGISIKK